MALVYSYIKSCECIHNSTMQTVMEKTHAEARLTPYFGSAWLVWMHARTGPANREAVSVLIDIVNASNEAYAEYLMREHKEDRTVYVDVPHLKPEYPQTDRDVVVYVLTRILKPYMRHAYKGLDPDFEHTDWAEAFKVLVHCKAMVFITEEVLREMDVRMGKWMLNKAFSIHNPQTQ